MYKRQALGQSGKDVTEQLQSGILRDTAVAATAMDLDDQTAGEVQRRHAYDECPQKFR